MAVQDKYTDSNFSGDVITKVLKALNGQGVKIGALLATFEVAAADNEGSGYRVFPKLDPSLIPLAIMVANDAITNGTVYDVGLYKTSIGGAAISDALFASALDLSSAHASVNPKTALDGMKDVDIADMGKDL